MINARKLTEVHMTDEQGANEIKYRVASLLLLSMLDRGLITHDEYVKAKKKLQRKYSPIIGCLEELE